MLYKKRDRFEGLSIRIGIAAAKLGLSPNHWTILALIPALMAVWFLIGQQWLIAAALFSLSSFIDLVDGSVARVTGSVTKLGAYLDTIVDRYVEFAILFGLLLVPLPQFVFPSYIWIFVYLFGSLMTTYSKAAAKEKELTETEIKGGILERAERLILLFFAIILAAFDKIYLVYIVVILAVLTNITALQRIYITAKLQL